MNNKVVSVDQLELIKNNYSKQNGYYESMGVGLADNLKATLGATDTESYIFRTTGGNADVTNIKKVSKIVAKSVKYNQLVQNGNFESTSNWFMQNGELSVSNNVCTFHNTTASGYCRLTQTLTEQNKTTDGHKYIFLSQIKHDYNDNLRLFVTWDGSSGNTFYKDFNNNVWNDFSNIFTAIDNTDYSSIFFDVTSIVGTVNVSIKNIKLIDLTVIFGARNEPTTIEQFYATDLGKILKVGYCLPYSTGAILHTKITGMKNVGYNAYNNENPNDFIKVAGGLQYTIEGTYTSIELYNINKNLLEDTFVNEQELPQNCAFVKITGGNDTTCFHLTWSGSRTGFEPYKKWEYPFSFEGYGAGNVGDELKSDGIITRKIGIVDLGTLKNGTIVDSEEGIINLWDLSESAKVLPDLAITPTNMSCSKYSNIGTYYIAIGGRTQETELISITGDKKTIYIKSAAFIGKTWSECSASLSGVYLYYEKETPTTEQGTPFAENQVCDDYGTEEFIYPNDVSIPVPVGHDTFYQINLQNFLQRTYQRVNGNPSDFAKVSDINSLLPSTDDLDNTKTYTLKIVSGVKTWVEEQQ